MRIRTVVGVILAGVVLFGLIQLIPYGHNHTNPPVSQEVRWDSPQTRALAVRACFDCHSNETVWPWYSNIAPISWLIQHDVEDGRGKLNFSEWDKAQSGASKVVREIQSGSMPKFYYVPIHPSANLSETERNSLIEGLRGTLGQK